MSRWVDLVFDWDPGPDDLDLTTRAFANAGFPVDVARSAPNTIRVSHESGGVVVAAVEWFRGLGWSCGRGDVDLS